MGNCLQKLLVTAVLAGTVSAGYAEVLYTLTDIGGPTGQPSIAFGVNDLGQVVGSMQVEGVNRSFLRDADGTIHTLPSLGGVYSAPFKISNAGQIVGWASGPDRRQMAADYGRGDSLTLLGVDTFAAYDVNDSGIRVGSTRPDGPFVAAVWDSTGRLARMADRSSEAFSVNDSGQVVGWASLDGLARAVIWSEDGTFEDLGSLQGPLGSSIAFGNNNRREIVGASGTGNQLLGFVYDPVNGMRDLGTLAGQYTRAMAINDAGQVVGESKVGNETHGFIYQAGQITDLNNLIDPSLGWTVCMGFDINSAGQIVGYGEYGGVERAILLTPIPEPSTLSILAYAMLSLGLMRRRPLPR